MKKNTLLLRGLVVSTSFLFSQEQDHSLDEWASIGYSTYDYDFNGQLANEYYFPKELGLNL